MKQHDMAQRALIAVEQMKNEGELNGKFKTLCMKSPSVLIRSGLAQSITYLRSRNDTNNNNKYGDTYLEHLIDVLGRKNTSVAKFQDVVLDAKIGEYMALTHSVQDAMIWLRRFAQVEMANVEEDSEG